MIRTAASVAIWFALGLVTVANAQKSDFVSTSLQATSVQRASENVNIDIADGLPTLVTQALDADDSTYNRQVSGCGGLSGIGTSVFYDTVTLTNTSGVQASIELTTSDVGDPSSCTLGDTHMSVYSPTFNAVDPLTNCVTSNDDSGPGACSAVDFDLGVGETAVVVTTSFGNGAQFPFQLNIDSDSCNDGLVYDDGTIESALQGPMGTATVELTQKFDLPLIGAAGAAPKRVCACFSRTVSATDDFEVNFVVRRPDSSGDAPGARLKTEAKMIMDVPNFPACRYYALDVTDADFTTDRIFIGVEWDQASNPQLLLGNDTNGPTTQPGFSTANGGASWNSVTVQDPAHRNLALRSTFDEPFTPLSNASALVVPGYQIDLADPSGPTTLFAARNTTDDNVEVNVEFHGQEATPTPLRVDGQALAANDTMSVNMRDDTSSLDPDGDDLAAGLALIYRTDTGTHAGLEGDFLNVDAANDFAGGDRLFKLPEDLCNLMEVRFLNFGAGSNFSVVVDQPQGDVKSTYSYEAYRQDGTLLGSGDYFTNKHFEVIAAQEFAGMGNNFGTVVFDFSKAGGGRVIGQYSAFGRFSVEVAGACRD